MQNVLKEAKLQLGEILSAFEFIDRPALDIVSIWYIVVPREKEGLKI
jgi:hypothetical protein